VLSAYGCEAWRVRSCEDERTLSLRFPRGRAKKDVEEPASRTQAAQHSDPIEQDVL
jgi:hypothetical protein